VKVSSLEIPEVLLIEPRVFADDRGYFFENWSTRNWGKTGGFSEFVQDNTSYSKKNVLRGLHIQNPNGQGKLVSALAGTVWDVAIDLRVGSKTFGKWVGAELSESNHHQLFIPPGFGHGFCVLSESALVTYKCTALYEPSSEFSLSYADPELGIRWPVETPLLSPKDAAAPRLGELIAAGRLPRFTEEKNR
jgi:dTDP-4-dehydrorhamnose 3,5-epimerase